eukprot:2165093-Rhodomonas_salina.1
MIRVRVPAVTQVCKLKYSRYPGSCEPECDHSGSQTRRLSRVMSVYFLRWEGKKGTTPSIP